MQKYLVETKVDQSKLYFHGSSEAKVDKLQAPSFRHPFYVTSDLHYAMAFCTKIQSQTGDYDEEKIYNKNPDENFVYVVTLKPTCKVFDFRDHTSTEFKKIFKLFDEELFSWLTHYNSIQFKYDLGDIYEFCNAIQTYLMKPIDDSGVNYIAYSKNFPDDENILEPRQFLKACSFLKKTKLLGKYDEYDTHQVMEPILRFLQSQGFHGVLTREIDFNDEDVPSKVPSLQKVTTSYAIGIFDKNGLDLLGLVPLSYKWLKTINPSYLLNKTDETADEKIRTFIKNYKQQVQTDIIKESKIDTSSIWYFGNNRSKNLKLVTPKWYAPFFLTTSFEYAENYSDYGVYKIELDSQIDLNILDFNVKEEVQKLGWSEVLIDKILEGRNDLNSLAYDLYLLANGNVNDLLYIENTDEWLDIAIWFYDRSKEIFKLVHTKGTWGSDDDHQIVLQMWKDIYDAGFDGFTHVEFGNKVLALFDLKYIDKISVKPIVKPLNEDIQSSNLNAAINDVLSAYKQKFGFDLSYMKFKADSQPVYTNGEPCYEYNVDECAGDWTSLGWIRLNPDMKSVMDRYGIDWHGSGDIEEFTKFIIAHELAHEVWNNIANDDFKDDILNNARSSSFSTKYLDTVKPSKLDEETFCEYLAHEIVPQKKDILFPNEEIADLSKQKHIVTHRVSNDVSRFNVGDVVLSPWEIPYKVSSKLIVDKVEDSHYANDLTPQQLTFLDDFDEIAVLELDAQYEPPYSLEQIKAKYPEHIYSKLANDPVHRWRAETGIELIHKEPTEKELDRIWKNWQLMPQDLKDISDQKCIEFFGCTNHQHYARLRSKYITKKLNENKTAYLKKFQDEPEVKSIVDKFWTIRQRLKNPENDIDWWIKKPYSDFKNFVLTFDDRNKSQKKQDTYRSEALQNGAKHLDTKDGYEIWYVPTYESMVILGRFYKGRSAKWCVASDDPEFWYENHDEDEFVLLIRVNPQNDEFDKIALQMENRGRYFDEDSIIPWDLENKDWTFDRGVIDNSAELIRHAWELFKDNGELRDRYFE